MPIHDRPRCGAQRDSLRREDQIAAVACPICHDPRGYPLGWYDADPPRGCPSDRAWLNGGEPSIKSVSECSYQRDKAWQAAEFRKLVPDAFDGNGAIIPGQIGRVLEAFVAKHPTVKLIMG